MAEYDVAVVDAGGAVGEAVIDLLEQRRFPVRTLYPLTAGEGGEKLPFRGKRVLVQEPDGFDYSQVDLAFFCGGPGYSEAHAPQAAAAGCSVIDCSGRFAGQPDVPLVLAEFNAEALSGLGRGALIALPTPAVAQLLAVLGPIREEAGLAAVSVSTYHAVSADGRAGVEELATQTAQLLNARPAKGRVYPKQIAFNCLPQVGELDEHGDSREERLLVEQSRRLLDLPQLPISATAVQVPVFFGHGLAVHLQTERDFQLQAVRERLAAAPGLKLLGSGAADWPTAVTDAANHDHVFVGRLREDRAQVRGLNFWVVADNVRKGTALNSIQIAEQLVRDAL